MLKETIGTLACRRSLLNDLGFMDVLLLSAVLLLLSSYIVFSLEVLAADRCRVQGWGGCGWRG